MQTAATSLWQFLNPVRLAGPMFYKELRVASRRRRFYVLRSAYVCLLTLVIIQVWFFVVRFQAVGPAVVQASRLGEAGRHIAVTIVWFQFITGQVLATVLLSTAISSEIRQRTLDALLVTPIGSIHIVAGKLLSRLLQLVLILAISLPLLAVVRIFGGVPWDYIVSGICITLAAAVFAGSLSLLSSTTRRHPHEAVLVVGLWYLVVWGLVAGLLLTLGRTGYIRNTTVTSVLFLANPFLALLECTQVMLRGGSAGGLPFWWLHCLIILAGAGVILAAAVWHVRRSRLVVVLTCEEKQGGSVRASSANARRAIRQQERARRAARPVKGAPIVWKELCTPLFATRRGRWFAALALIVAIGAVIAATAVAYGFAYALLWLLISVLQFLFIIRLAVSAASAITKEREARTWPILLATPLDNREIMLGKAVGSFRRNLPLLLPLPVLYVLVVLLSLAEWPHLSHTAISAGTMIIALAATVLFLLGVGLYLSVRLKTTTGAVATTLAIYFAPKLFCGGFNPTMLGAAGILGVGAAGGFRHVGVMITIVLVPIAVYMVVGLLFLGAAVRRVRKNVF